MGHLDQFAKQTFADETAELTHGALEWRAPPELTLSHLHPDGLIALVGDANALATLPAPWRCAQEHDEILVEIKLAGDHLDLPAIERAFFRRHARQIERVEDTRAPFRGQQALWMVGPSVPEALLRTWTCERIAPGCYRIDPTWFPSMWIAANELPLADEFVPFLVARSGRALVEFAWWVATRRPPEWVLNMVQILPMPISTREDLLRYIPRTDDPEIRARQRHVAKVLVDMDPELQRELTERGRDEGLAPLAHLFERRLGRRLTVAEHHTLRDRLPLLGPDRLGDVVLDFDADTLTAWLADPEAR